MATLTLQVENPSTLARLRKVLKTFQGVKIVDTSDAHTVDTAWEEVPNAVTLAAMKEVESGNDAGDVCMDNLDSFIASMQ